MRFLYFFFFNDTATTEIYTLSLHDALPISAVSGDDSVGSSGTSSDGDDHRLQLPQFTVHSVSRRSDPKQLDRKSTRLNSSHVEISYAVFCLKKKKKKKK